MASPEANLYDVAIAGGGYAGLALALALSRALGSGTALALVERAPLERVADTRDPRAFAIAAGSRRLLEALDVWGEIAAFAEPVLGIDITDSGLNDAVRPILLGTETEVDGEPQTHIVEAWRLRAALLARVREQPCVTLLAPAEARDLVPIDGAMRVQLSSGEAIEARLVAAADGAGSPLRAAAGIGVVGGSYGQVGIVATVNHERPHDGRAVQHFLPGGPFALLPLGGQRCCITWSESAARAAEILALPDEAFLAEAQLRAGWRLGRLTLAGARASWPLASHLARQLVAPRLALVGDAARNVHPIAGQGVNLGLRDVAALAEAIVDGMRLGLEPGDATILEHYERWRRFDGVQSATTFSALNTLFSNDWSALRGIRDAGLGVVHRLPGLKRLLVAEAAGDTGEVPRLLRGQAL